MDLSLVVNHRSQSTWLHAAKKLRRIQQSSMCSTSISKGHSTKTSLQRLDLMFQRQSSALMHVLKTKQSSFSKTCLFFAVRFSTLFEKFQHKTCKEPSTLLQIYERSPSVSSS